MSNKQSFKKIGYTDIIAIIVGVIMIVSFAVGVSKISSTDLPFEQDISSEEPSDISVSEEPEQPSVPEQKPVENKYKYYNELDLKNTFVSNSTVANGALSVITKSNAVFPTVDENVLKSFYSYTNKHKMYGLSDINQYAFSEAAEYFDKFIVSFCTAVPDNNILIDKGYVSPDGTFKGSIVNNVDFDSQDIDLMSGYTIRLGRYPKGNEYSYLVDQSYKYGIVQRYPDNRENYTGFSESKSIYRYVGLEHSEYMNYYNYSLEEYIDKLRTEKVIEFDSDLFPGIAYVTCYFPVDVESNETIIKVPFEDSVNYTISGDGTRGFIVTITVKK